MDYDGMAHFVRHTMDMRNVYQPIMIRALVESGGKATDADIARAFMGEDRARLEHYVRVAKRWPRQVLESHGVVKYERGARGKRGVFTLSLEGATEEQRRRIAELCNSRLEEYIEEEIKNMPHLDGLRGHPAVTDEVKDEVLEKSGGMCAACNTRLGRATTRINHIIPPSIGGGSDDPANLQALCAVCNLARSDRNALELVMVRNRLKYRKGCYLCGRRESADLGNELAVAVPAMRPAAEHHWIVAPKSHVSRFDEMLPAERHFCMDLIEPAKERMRGAGCGGCEFSVSMREGAAGGGGHFGIDVVAAPVAGAA